MDNILYIVVHADLWTQLWLTAQFKGHCLGLTHLLLKVSITWPAGQAQPGIHVAIHIGLGLEHVALQEEHCWNICPSTGQPKYQNNIKALTSKCHKSIYT